MVDQKLYEKVAAWLFETNAIRVAPADKPYWYTSGKIGPYYINTHFLYGNEEKANKLLEIIDRVKDDKFWCPEVVLKEVRKNYETEPVYHDLMDEMANFIKKNVYIHEIDYISCGERRDWFFAPLVAEMLRKPYIFIYKDLGAVRIERGEIQPLKDNGFLKGKKVFHIADLVTEASSYTRAWIPAIKSFGAEIKWSLAVVDRNQGGQDILRNEGIAPFELVKFDMKLFEEALGKGYVTQEQFSQIKEYFADPKGSMRKFLLDNPSFLKNARSSSDKKLKERAELLIKENHYELGDMQ